MTGGRGVMQLKVLLPTQVLVQQDVIKVAAESRDGSFALLPRHIDYVAALIPSIFAYVTPDEHEHFLAIDEAILVKQGQEIRVSATRAIPGQDLEYLEASVSRELRRVDENEQRARSVSARLEADTLRRFAQLGGPPR